MPEQIGIIERLFRGLIESNVLDEGVREGLAIEIGTSLSAERVIRMLEQVVAWRGHHRCYGSTMALNCSPVSSSPGVRTEALSCATNQVSQHRTASSNGSTAPIAPKCSIPIVFESLDQVRELSANWLQSYNEERPHEALAGVTPALYRDQRQETRSSLSVVSR